MMPLLTSISKEFVDVIDESVTAKQCLNFRDISSRYMCEVIGQVAFGLQCNANTSNLCDEIEKRVSLL